MFAGIQKGRSLTLAQISQVRFTAKSKQLRIPIQLLKDFPGVGVRGEIVHVKASAMSSKFYPNQGAVYLNFKGAEPAIPVFDRSAEEAKSKAKLAAQSAEKLMNKKKLDDLKAKVKEENNAKKNQLKSGTSQQSQQSNSDESLLSLDEILSLDFNTLPEAKLQAIFSVMPSKILFAKHSTGKSVDAITKESILGHLESSLVKKVRDANAVLKFISANKTILSFKNEAGEPLSEINKLGNYFVTIAHDNLSSDITLVVNSSNEK